MGDQDYGGVKSLSKDLKGVNELAGFWAEGQPAQGSGSGGARGYLRGWEGGWKADPVSLGLL